MISTSWYENCDDADTPSATVQAENTILEEAATQGRRCSSPRATPDPRRACRAVAPAHACWNVPGMGSPQPFATGVGSTSWDLGFRSAADRDDLEQTGRATAVVVVASPRSGRCPPTRAMPRPDSTSSTRTPPARRVAPPRAATSARIRTSRRTRPRAARTRLSTRAAGTASGAQVPRRRSGPPIPRSSNGSSACHGTTVGFANPLLYQIAANNYANAFNDVTSGNNDISGDNGELFPAGAGYDMATGLGTPNGAVLGQDLCAARATAVTVTDPGNQSNGVGESVSLPIQASDSTGGDTLLQRDRSAGGAVDRSDYRGDLGHHDDGLDQCGGVVGARIPITPPARRRSAGAWAGPGPAGPTSPVSARRPRRSARSPGATRSR